METNCKLSTLIAAGVYYNKNLIAAGVYYNKTLKLCQGTKLSFLKIVILLSGKNP